MPKGNVIFEGDGPFYIRTVEHAIASSLDHTVQLTFYITVEGEKLVQIETQMTAEAAEELAHTLIRAIDDVDQDVKMMSEGLRGQS